MAVGSTTKTSGEENFRPCGASEISRPMVRRLGRLLGSVWMLGLAAGALVIGWASRVYFASDELAPFVIEKLPLPHEDLWLAALKVHVVAASFALPACLLLLLQGMLCFPRVHRWLGRGTGTVI